MEKGWYYVFCRPTYRDFFFTEKMVVRVILQYMYQANCGSTHDITHDRNGRALPHRRLDYFMLNVVAMFSDMKIEVFFLFTH